PSTQAGQVVRGVPATCAHRSGRSVELVAAAVHARHTSHDAVLCVGSPSVELLPGFQHCHERLDAAATRLLPLRVLDAVEDRVAVAAVERFEGALRLAVPVECLLQVVGYSDACGRRVRGIAAPVRASRLDGGQTCWAHIAGGDQLEGGLTVLLRPLAERAWPSIQP